MQPKELKAEFWNDVLRAMLTVSLIINSEAIIKPRGSNNPNDHWGINGLTKSDTTYNGILALKRKEITFCNIGE